MSRISVGAFGALVAATVAAFFVTQHLKVTTPVLTGISHPEAFSPGTCQPRTHISFYLLHRADDVSLYVVDSNGSIVRTLAVGYHMRKGVRPADGAWNTWNGREDSGKLAADGTYHFRIGLSNQGRTIDLPGYPVLLKTVAPRPVVTHIENQLLPAKGAKATIHYTGASGRVGTIRVYRTDLNPVKPQRLYSFPTPSGGSTVHWDGKVFGRPAPSGVYLIGLDVTDRACNTGRFPPLVPPTPGSTPDAGVTVRYLAAEPPLDPVRAGGQAVVFVDSRQHPYQWQLRRVGSARVLARGTGNGYKLTVPLPRGGAGLYQLSIHSGGYHTDVPIVARASPPRRAGILVVLPALTWQGQNPVDDDGDGMPNTLEGGPIQVNRVLVNGLPTGFSDEAAFVAYLDHSHLPYDLTTDIGLIDGKGPALAGHSGVVLAGSERWLPDTVVTGLRSYVQGGGRVLSLGIDSLLRGVTVQTTARGVQAVSPTAPRPTDALGGRPGAVAQSTAETLVIRDELGIFSTTSGAFPGYTSYQPVEPPSATGQISSAGVTSSAPSVVGYRVGRGIAVEVGLVGFGSSVAHSVNAQELTHRLWTVLSH